MLHSMKDRDNRVYMLTVFKGEYAEAKTEIKRKMNSLAWAAM